MSPDSSDNASRETVTETTRLRRQQGLIREALYIFLAIAIVMAVLLDGVSLFTTQQDARDDASDAGREAQHAYVETGSVDQARLAAATHVENNGGELVAFSVSVPSGGGSEQYTVTVRQHAETYLFKYLRYIPGLDDWVKDMADPTITRTTP